MNQSLKDPRHAGVKVLEVEVIAKNDPLPTPTTATPQPVSFVTTSADDSLAIKYSVLSAAETRKDEDRKLIYAILWPLMVLVAAWCAFLIIGFRVCVKMGLIKVDPTDADRMLLGPKKLTWWFDRWHKLGFVVRNGVRTSSALDVIYAIMCYFKEVKSFEERVIRFWLNQPEGQAVTNRLRRTHAGATEELERLIKAGRTDIGFLVLACGSAQASIEAVQQTLQKHPGITIKLTLVDRDIPSLRKAQRFAEDRGVAHALEIFQCNLNDFLSAQKSGAYDIVEMVGFLDYQKRKKFVAICRAVSRVMAPEGLLITAAICRSWGSFIVRWVINWPSLIRRSPKEIEAMLSEVFTRLEPRPEPHKIHHTVLCRK